MLTVDCSTKKTTNVCGWSQHSSIKGCKTAVFAKISFVTASHSTNQVISKREPQGKRNTNCDPTARLVPGQAGAG
jgi:hypothetical protein